jgi:A/G-specific adenine glycosylase
MNKNSLHSSFTRSLLSWFKKEKRTLPFRETKDPYRVWLSEIILQQTQMETGLKYYKKFIDKFPKIEDLAKAKQEEVYSLWQGLGYYNRAKNLHKTATIITQGKNKFPKKFECLIKLPGIGKYTASAIASICFNERRYVVDANVYRVLSRAFGLKTNINNTKAYGEFYDLTSSLGESAKNTGDYNEAIMDFGGTVCLPKRPKCEVCFYNKKCFGFKKDLVKNLPVKKDRKKTKNRFFNYFVFESKDGFLIKKRSKKDIWENLFEFYLVENKNSKKALELLEKSTTKKLPKPETKKTFTVLSHQKIEVVFYNYFIEKKGMLERLKESLKMKLIKKSEVKNFGFPKVVDNYLKSRS